MVQWRLLDYFVRFFFLSDYLCELVLQIHGIYYFTCFNQSGFFVSWPTPQLMLVTGLCENISAQEGYSFLEQKLIFRAHFKVHVHTEKETHFLHTFYTLVSYHLRPNVMIKIAQGLTFRVTLQWEIFES